MSGDSPDHRSLNQKEKERNKKRKEKADPLCGHAGLVEARVEQQHGDALCLQLLRHQHRPDITGRPAHVVAVVPAGRVLHEPPTHPPNKNKNK